MRKIGSRLACVAAMSSLLPATRPGMTPSCGKMPADSGEPRRTSPMMPRCSQDEAGTRVGRKGLHTMSKGSSGSRDSHPEENFPGQAFPDESSDDVHAWYQRGMELLRRGSPAAAAQVLQRASTAEPGSRSVRE